MASKKHKIKEEIKSNEINTDLAEQRTETEETTLLNQSHISIKSNQTAKTQVSDIADELDELEKCLEYNENGQSKCINKINPK